MGRPKKIIEKEEPINNSIENPLTLDLEKDENLKNMKNAPLIEKFSSNELNNLKFLLTDLLSGDNSILKRDEYKCFNINEIQIALKWLLENKDFSETFKGDIFSELWRLNYRVKPPTPEEFCTKKYIGSTAEDLYPFVKEAFIESFNPLKPYRASVLSCCIGWGKAQPMNSKVYTSKNTYKTMGDIKVGDSVYSPIKKKLSKVSKVHPQGKIDCYKIKMNNGAYFECALEHLHLISYRKDSNNKDIWEIVNTKFILANKDKKFKFRRLKNG